MTATPDADVELQLGLDVAAATPASGTCQTCLTSMHLAAGVVPLHPTRCPCQRRHLADATCPFVTTCPGSHRRPRP